MSSPATPLVAAADVKVDGRPLDAAVAGKLLEARVDLQARLPDRCSLRFADPDLALVDRDSFPLGSELEVALAAADATSPTVVFSGQVASLEPEFDRREAVLVVRAYDRAHLLARERRTESYQQMSCADIARKAASRNGLSAGTMDAAGGPVPFVQQSNETDWELLWRLADEVGCGVQVEGRKLHFREAGAAAGSPAVALTWGEALLEFRPRVTGVQQVANVEVRGWDPATQKAIVGSATPDTAGTEIGIARGKASSALGGGKVIVADRPVMTAGQATKLAGSVAGQVGASFAEAEGVAIGDPRLKAGGRVSVEGVGARFGGTYALTSVAHVVRAGRGYETRFAAGGRAPRTMLGLTGGGRGAPWARSVVVGVVTNNQDPDAMGRVRVRYPVLGDAHEGWWARLTGPAAGTRRGMLMLPQVGDEVLVAFEHDDADHPYVLGGVWNGMAKPQELVHPDGSFALRSDKQVAVEAAEAITLAGDQTIKLSSAGDATITTNERSGEGGPGNATVDAKGTATVKAGTTLTLNGGSDVKVTGASSVSIGAGAAQVKLEGGQVTLQATSLRIQASGMVQIAGAQIMLG